MSNESNVNPKTLVSRMIESFNNKEVVERSEDHVLKISKNALFEGKLICQVRQKDVMLPSHNSYQKQLL